MKKNNFYKDNVICFAKKAAFGISICFILIGLLFVFSCTPLNDLTKTPDSNTAGDSTGEAVEEESEDNNKDKNNEQSAETEEDETTGNEDAEDTGEEQTESAETGDITINVYYSDNMGQYLVGEARTVSSENKYVEALNELMKLPIDGSLHRLIPESTKINSVTVEDGLAKVDFSKEFVEDRFQSDTVDILLIYSVVNTLTEFSEINSVSFYIDGEKLNILGQLAIDEPIFRRSDLIKQ